MDPAWAEAPDFWLLDDETVFVQRYDGQGGFLGADRADDPSSFLEAQALLSSLAVPFGSYELSDAPPLQLGRERHPYIGPPTLGLQRVRSCGEKSPAVGELELYTRLHLFDAGWQPERDRKRRLHPPGSLPQRAHSRPGLPHSVAQGWHS